MTDSNQASTIEALIQTIPVEEQLRIAKELLAEQEIQIAKWQERYAQYRETITRTREFIRQADAELSKREGYGSW